MSTNKKYHYINFLRGIAILLVIATHIKGIIPNCSNVMNALLSFGRMGVQLFFVISACTLYLSWQNRRSESRPLLKFYLRRYFRIAPLYYFGILLYFFVALISHYNDSGLLIWPEQFKPLSVLLNILLLHGFYPPGNNNIVPGGWSIGTEFLFYLIFPFLINLLNNYGNRIWMLFVFLYAILLTTIHFKATSSGFQMSIGDYFFHCIINQLPVFLLGITAAHGRDLYATKASSFVDLTLFCVCILIALMIWNSSNSVMMSVLPIVVGVSFVFLMFFVSRIPDWVFEIFLVPICWFGKISFSMYIWHFVAIRILRELLPETFLQGKDLSLLVFYVSTILSTVVISYLSEKIIEANGIKLGQRVMRGLH